AKAMTMLADSTS
ncbi:hypothetical protein A2U01_0016356, partial [Trifolium medium]|nr:hypothetical protein [Trifolium medium]